MDERTINTLGKTNKQKLREYKNVKSITQLRKLYPKLKNENEIYEKIKFEYNYDVTRRNIARKEVITKARSDMSRKLSKLAKDPSKGLNIDLTPLHKGYSLKGFIEDLLQRVDKYLPNEKLLLEVNGVNYALGRQTRQKLVELINSNMVIEGVEGEGSDVEFFVELQDAREMKITPLSSEVKSNDWFQRTNPTGGFFPYYNKTKYDFSRYGVFNDEEQYINECSDVCIIQALRNGGLSDEKYEHLKTLIKHSHMPISKIKEVCENLKIQIQLKRKVEEKMNIYGAEYDEIYKIGLLEDHYFILETTENTSFSLTNYEEVKDIEQSNFIYTKEGKYYKKKQNRVIDSFSIVILLIKHKDTLLEKIPYQHLTRTQYHTKFNEEINDLHYDEKNLTLIENEDKTKKENLTNIFFDFETRTLEQDKKHEPYLCCFLMDDGRRGSFVGKDCALQMLKYLSCLNIQKIQLIAHNATYDYQFLLKHLTMENEISRGNRLISANGKFNKMKVVIKDSYHLIAAPLRNFGDMFKLQQKKEVMPYDLYNIESVFDSRYVNIDYALSFVKDNEKKDFLRNIDDWKLKRDDNTYDIIEYSRLYCELDCVVLRDGYNVFRQWILSLNLPNGNAAGLDINNILTCAGLAHRYLIKSDCYDGVYELNGVPQRFIQKTVVGGRTMCANNKKRTVDDGRRISDFDGVSLYPSAMNRMTGFLKGKPKVLNTTDYNVIKNYDGYFVELQINNIPVKRSFPLASNKNSEGIRIFTNVINGTIYVDKIQLEDLITFHGLQIEDFQIIKGYYFNDGFNSNINKTIQYLFNTRLQKKQENNPSETIYKLIMNSAYGKSIMKEILTETRIFNNQHDYGVFVSRNYELVQTIQKVDDCDKYKVKTTATINKHVNIAQVGASVLSWSKRIMNEVMCLAEDNGIEIFYQDTDSMHLYEDQIQTLSSEFENKYGRQLIGESLGQFHTDFEIKYSEDGKKYKCKDVYSRRLIMLGKKSYCDELVGIDHNGNEKVQYHVRMKGIPNSCVDYTTKQLKHDNVFKLYEQLYKAKPVSFDLTEGNKKALFKYNGDYTVKTQTLFTRIVKF